MDSGVSITAVAAPVLVIAGRKTAGIFVRPAHDLVLDRCEVIARTVDQAHHDGGAEKELLEHG